MRDLRFGHALRLTKLVGEGYEIGARTEACRAHLLGAVAGLLGADIALYVVDDDFTMRGTKPLPFVRGFQSEAVRAALEAILSNGRGYSPLVRGMIRRYERRGALESLCASRRDVATDRDWYESAFVRDYFRPARLDDCLSVCLPRASAGEVNGVILFREWGARPFTAAERDAHAMFLLECDSLLQPSPADAKSLPPRLRQTLDLMLAGKSDKAIAVELGLSVHTAREYAKAVLRALGMNSRVELIARTLRPASRARP